MDHADRYRHSVSPRLQGVALGRGLRQQPVLGERREMRALVVQQIQSATQRETAVDKRSTEIRSGQPSKKSCAGIIEMRQRGRECSLKLSEFFGRFECGTCGQGRFKKITNSVSQPSLRLRDLPEVHILLNVFKRSQKEQNFFFQRLNSLLIVCLTRHASPGSASTLAIY